MPLKSPFVSTEQPATTSLFPQVRYEMLKSAHQRELSWICCAEIEVDGLGSYPHIPGGRPHGSDSRCRAAFGREPCDRGAATHRPRARTENSAGRTTYDRLRPDKRGRGSRCRSGAG